MIEPMITVVKNPITEKYTLTFQNWDTDEMVDGYTKEEAQNLIVQLESAIYHLDNCWEEDNHDSLFRKEKDEEASTR